MAAEIEVWRRSTTGKTGTARAPATIGKGDELEGEVVLFRRDPPGYRPIVVTGPRSKGGDF